MSDRYVVLIIRLAYYDLIQVIIVHGNIYHSNIELKESGMLESLFISMSDNNKHLFMAVSSTLHNMSPL